MPINDISQALPITVYPSMKIVDLMSTGDLYTHDTIPISFWNDSSVTQSLYTATEMGGIANRGQVKSMRLRYYNYDVVWPDAMFVDIYLTNMPADMTTLESWYEQWYDTWIYYGQLPEGNGHGSLVDFDIYADNGYEHHWQDFTYEGGGLLVTIFTRNYFLFSPLNVWHQNRDSGLENRSNYRHSTAPDAEIFYSPLYPKVIFLIDSSSATADETLSAGAGLLGNYPNPFNPSTTISFSLGNEGFVALDVYNVRGQRVRSLVRGVYGAGVHKVVWNGVSDDGRSVGSGVYFYRMVSGGQYVGVKKMLLIK